MVFAEAGVWKRVLLVFVCSTLPPPTHQQSYNESLVKNITKLLDTLLDNYDAKFRPRNGGPPLVVEISITVLSMGPVSEADMEFTMDCYFRQRWLDERLQFTGAMEKLSLASKVLKDIWRPDTYIRNGRQSYLHSITVPNILLRVKNTGEVFVSQRLTIRARCPMHLSKFPMDTQACPVFIGSLGYNDNDVVYKWDKLKVSAGINLAQYKLLRHIINEKNLSNVRNPVDIQSTLQAYFILERQQGFYILQMYTPCSLIVVMSWVSFWLNKEASPARVSLGIMTVLTMATLSLGGRDGLPRIGYSTAMDIYIVTCFGFVFLALIEYAVINFAHILYTRKSLHHLCSFGAIMMAAKEKQAEENRALRGDEITEEQQEVELTPVKSVTERILDVMLCRQQRDLWKEKQKEMKSWTERARKKLRESDPSIMVEKVDTVSKFMFPFAYCTFNFFYWSSYLYWIPDEIDQIPAIRDVLTSSLGSSEYMA